jgi:hypothetical protein
MKKLCFFAITIFALAGLLFLIGCSTGNDDNVRGEIINKTALREKIYEAYTERELTVVANSENEVPLGKFMVIQAEMTAFENAIATAENVFALTVSQAAVNSAVTILDNAITVFKNWRLPGKADPIDIAALNAKIAMAESLKSGVLVAINDNPSNVAQGAYWVPQSAMTTFEAAITTAKYVRDNAENQMDLNQATNTLDRAIITFTDSRRQNGQKLSGFSADEMTALIAMANTARTGVKISTNNGNDVGPVEFWVVSQNYLDALDTAIATAEAAAGNTINTAYLALVAAINTFNDAKKLGTLSNKAGLFDAIRFADLVKAGVVIAASKSEAPNGRYWATPAEWAPFNTAYNYALTAACNANATKNAVDAALSNLDTETNTFNQTVQGNGMGTKQNSITITGFDSSFPNETDIVVSLFLTNDFDIISTPQIRGTGTINNGTVTIELYETSGFRSWAGTGLWYVGFTVGRENPRYFFSKSAVNFSSTPQAVINFSGFKKYVFSAKLGDIAEWVFAESGQTMTMDEWFTQVTTTGMSYTEYLENGNSPFYTNEALTQPYGGTNTVNANTVIYSEYPIGGDIFSRGEKIGEITGTITLIGISSPPPELYIQAYSYWQSYESRINMSGVTGSSATVNWSIPIFESNRFAPGETNFRLRVVPSGSNNSLFVDIPNRKTVNSPNDNVESLGEVNIATITLSGTIDVSYRGETVPIVRIIAQAQPGSAYWTELSSPTTNVPWSIIMPAFDTQTEIKFRIEGYSNDWGFLFTRDLHLSSPIIVTNQDISDIFLNAVIKTITLSGTINASYGGDPVPQVEINVYTPYEIGSAHLNWPDPNAPWSITIAAFDSPTEITIKVTGLSTNWNTLFERDIPRTVFNQDISGIHLDAVIQTITLGGTLNVSYGGESVPQVVIEVSAQNQWIGNTSLNSPGNNAPWSITIAAFDSPTEIEFRISGYFNNWHPPFYEYFSPEPPITVSNQNRTDISLDVGNITNPSFNPVNVTPLSTNTWVNGEITNPNAADWYSIQMNAGQSCYIWWNDKWDGNSTKTADVMVRAYQSNGVEIFDEDNGWYSPQQFYAEADRTLYIRVYPYRTSDIGTYGIVYSTSDSRPMP